MTRYRPNEAATEGLFGPGAIQDVQAVADEIARIADCPRANGPYRGSVDFSDFGDVPMAPVAQSSGVG